MRNKTVLATLGGLALLIGVGTAAQASPTMTLYPEYFFIDESVVVQPYNQPVSQQDVVGQTEGRHPRPVYRWEKELQQDTAARSLIEEQLTGREPDRNYEGFFENYYQIY